MRGELDTYQAKRRFGETPEPKGRKTARSNHELRYLIQRHAATRLHYDFRIEAAAQKGARSYRHAGAKRK